MRLILVRVKNSQVELQKMITWTMNRVKGGKNGKGHAWADGKLKTIVKNKVC